ncbi:MAG: Rossmann-like and DUF2520 domain-containing protein [Dehalococcoidia bacterium]
MTDRPASGALDGWRPRIGVIGTGRLGASLALALDAAGHRVEALASLRGDSAHVLACRIEGATALDASALVDRCDLVFLTVPDGAVAPVSEGLSWRRGQSVVHCSGALGLDALESARSAGAEVGCMHPLQSFPDPRGTPEAFRGVTCGIEAAEPLGSRLEALTTVLGARPIRLEGVDRARYHAAAVFASNDVVALMQAARETWTAAGLSADEAVTALVPLLRGAVSNIEAASSLEKALTGPVARGDVETVRRHLDALASESEVATLYRELAQALLRLRLDLPPERLEALAELLAHPRAEA